VRKTWLPYGRQSVSDADVDAVAKVLRSDWLTQGPTIGEFENAISNYCGVSHAVAVNSGTAALHVAYFGAGVVAGDEVVMPGMSFAATGNAALYLGAKPVFADVDPDTGSLSVESAAKAITDKTKALVSVDFTGHPCDLAGLRALADKAEIAFIVDGAHSLGSTYNGKHAAQVADLTTFSFHPVKTITTGEGGMAVTNNKHVADRMRVFRTHGMEKDAANFMDTSQGPWYHEMQELGFNYRMTDFQAALGLSQLEQIDKFLARRRQIAATYKQEMPKLKHIRCLTEKPNAESAYHLFQVLIDKEPFAEKRKFAVEALHGENIGVQIHYIPIYDHPYYRQNVRKTKPECPNTDLFYSKVISLPIFPSMSDADVKDVLTALQKLDGSLE
jgi:UDP-4-amino-4,6-dideoxy-N-acetyl-beta-L-altrosamine transaminase